MTRVTRRYRFAASHRLHSGKFSERENSDLYGKCNNPYGHGHDYILEVTTSGPVDAVSGQAIHIQTLDALVHARVLKDLDHKYLNADTPEFAQLIPTSESIIRVIEDRLKSGWAAAFPGEWPRLENIRLQETRRNRFESRV